MKDQAKAKQGSAKALQGKTPLESNAPNIVLNIVILNIIILNTNIANVILGGPGPSTGVPAGGAEGKAGAAVGAASVTIQTNLLNKIRISSDRG